MINLNDLNDPSGCSDRSFEVIELHGPPPPLNSEFEPGAHSAAFAKEGLAMGRCFGSKSSYRRNNPGHPFIANANVFSRRHGKLWWGDLDLKIDASALERVARRLRCQLYVVPEFCGRFDSATLTDAEIKDRAVWCTGGARRLPGLNAYRARCGLTLKQLAAVANIPVRQLSRRLPPKTYLSLLRRLACVEDCYGNFAANHGYRRWGLWWTSLHPQLHGKSPLQMLSARGARALAALRKSESRQCLARMNVESDSTESVP